jgi:hypothetical protein
MRVLLLDPGLTPSTGHNHAVLVELDAELRRLGATSCVAACARQVDVRQFAHLACEVRTVFRLHGYARWAAADLARDPDPALLEQWCVEDLQSLSLQDFDVVLMPTAYPLHLAALATCGDSLAGVRIVCGLLMPPRFWATDEAALAMLESIMHRAVHQLSRRANTLLYSETGQCRIGSMLVATPSLLPPVSRATILLMEQLGNDRLAPDRPLRAGFLGQAELRKGFGHVAALVQSGLPPDMELMVRLPPGWEVPCTQWTSASPRVDASSSAMDNRAFLGAMARVDMVLAFYSPDHHADQMPGIVAEAICLGKPLLIANGCHALIDFLARHAPGSYMCQPWGLEGLVTGLTASREACARMAQAARASAAAMRELKAADRYLAIACGIEAPAQ